MPEAKTFDIEIVRRLPRRLHLPEPEECREGGFAWLNDRYSDLRGTKWRDVVEALDEEDRLIADFLEADDPRAECQDPDYNPYSPLQGMDIGVASTALALAAARCIPVSSCNGGALGGDHYMSNPLVAFYGSRPRARLLLKIAASAEVGIQLGPEQCLVVHARSVADMQKFAQGVLEHKAQFKAIPASEQEVALIRRARRPRSEDYDSFGI